MTFSLAMFAFFVSLDRFAALHVMISRPIVIATIVGLLTSNLYLTFYIGILIEIFGLIDVQVGTRIPREDSFVAFVISVLVGNGYFTSVSKFLVILLLLLLLMYAANMTEELVRNINKKVFTKYPYSNWPILFGVVVSGLRGVLVYSAGVYFCILVIDYLGGIFKHGHNIKTYSIFISILLSGYLLRFLSFKSLYKYIIFLLGLFLGWLIV